MRLIGFPLTLVFVASLGSLFAPQRAVGMEGCGLNGAGSEENGGPICQANADPLCMLGDRKALVVFVKFKGDTDSQPCFVHWPYSITQLEPWMETFLSDTCSSPGDCPGPTPTDSCEAARIDTFAVEPSLTDYYDEMSEGKFWLWGTVFPVVVETLHNPGTYGSGTFERVGNANWEILNRIDSDSLCPEFPEGIDFADYDRNPEDGYVDQIFMIYRNFTADQYSGFAWLVGTSCTDAGSLYVSHDSASGEPVKIDLDFGGDRPSGVSVEAMNVQLAIQTAAHEAGHNFFSRQEDWGFNHPVFLSTFGVMDAGIAMSAFERERMGWSTLTTITGTQTDVVLADAFRGSPIVEIPVRDSTEYFLIENRAGQSWYDHEYEDSFPDCSAGGLPDTPPEGAVIYHVDLEGFTSEGLGNNRYRKLVDVEVAAGLFDTAATTTALDPTDPDPFSGLDSLDLATDSSPAPDHTFGKTGANTFAPYTSPNTNAYNYDSLAGLWTQTVYTGINVRNIQSRNDTVTLDVVLAGSPADSAHHVPAVGTGPDTTTWRGTVYLTGDVVVDSLVTLQVAAATDILSRYELDNSPACAGSPCSLYADYAGGGEDPTRIELIVSDGARLDVDGGSGNFTSTFSSTKAFPDTNDWYGIEVQPGGTLEMTHAEVSYAQWGIGAVSPERLFIENSSIHHNWAAGVYAESKADTFRIEDCRIYSNGYSGVTLAQRKNTTAGAYLLSVVEGSRIYDNGNLREIGGGDLGGPQVEYLSLGGTSMHLDSLRNCTIGVADSTQLDGVTSDWSGGSGWHRTIMVQDTLTNFDEDAIAFTDLDSSRVMRCRISDAGLGLHVATGSVVSVHATLFDRTNTTHVLNDSATTTVLDSNALYVPPPDSIMVTNDDTDTLKAEYNWWEYSGLCPQQSLPAVYFTGNVDWSPRLCTEPVLMRPWSGGEWPSDEAESAQFELSVLRNPTPGYVSVRYRLPPSHEYYDVEVSVYDVAGRLLRHSRYLGQAPGPYQFHWHGGGGQSGSVPAGVYFVRVEAGPWSATKKVVLLR